MALVNLWTYPYSEYLGSFLIRPIGHLNLGLSIIFSFVGPIAISAQAETGFQVRHLTYSIMENLEMCSHVTECLSKQTVG